MYNITFFKKATPILIIFLVGFCLKAFSQVSIAPTSLYFNSQQRFSSLMISNNGQQAQEVSISTEFGYPTTEDGNLIITKDSALATQKSIADWIKIFPKNFTLQPQQRQTVRFVVRPPAKIEPGGYWSRVKIQSNPVSPPIESVDENQVGAQINLVVNQVISAHFRTKNASTDVEVTDIKFTPPQSEDNKFGQLAVSMKQTGNAPFIGSIQFSIKDSNGKVHYQTNTTNSVYTSITRTFQVDISDIPAGEYIVSGSIVSERPDVSQSNLLQIRPVNFKKEILIE